MSVDPIAMLTSEEFERGREFVPEFSNYFSYEDWVDSREGLFIGLSMAGADSRLVSVSLEDFRSWCDAQGVNWTPFVGPPGLGFKV